MVRDVPCGDAFLSEESYLAQSDSWHYIPSLKRYREVPKLQRMPVAKAGKRGNELIIEEVNSEHEAPSTYQFCRSKDSGQGSMRKTIGSIRKLHYLSTFFLLIFSWVILGILES